MNYSIPQPVQQILAILESNGFEAFVVGGCVRGLLLGSAPKDWDITTNATPEKIVELFPDSVYENAFGTVGVKTGSEDPALALVEVTPYRAEGKYTDKRHPDDIRFVQKLDEDLSRRDFTINAMALHVPSSGDHEELIDEFDGEKDIERKIIRAVGDPDARFTEDALRLLRAVRFATQLNFEIEKRTADAIKKHAGFLEFISKERIRDEFSKLLMTDSPMRGLELLHEYGLLKFILPELEEGVDVGQNLHHIYTVWEHNIRALQCAAENTWPLDVRLAALLHDVGKPRAKRGEGKHSTFYGHDVVGAKMASPALERLRYPKAVIEKVTKLIRYHLFYYNVDEVTPSSVRRLIQKVGPEDMDDLINVRICDRIGSGVPKAEPYRLRHFRFMVERLQRDPISVGMLAIDGSDVMRETGIPPSPKVGFLLNILLEDVLDDPAKNTKEHLISRVKTLAAMSDIELAKLAEEAKKKSSALEEEEVSKIKGKHRVR